MLKSAVIALSIAIIPAMSARVRAAEPEISTSGTGTVLASPDRAQIDFSIITRAKRSEGASSENAGIGKRVTDRLGDMGFGRETVQTVYYGVNAEYGSNVMDRKPVITGYVAVHRMRVRTGDLKKTGTIVDAVLDAGASEIDDISYTSSKVDSLRQVALENAVKNALGDARAMARSAGGNLGDLVELKTAGEQNFFPMESRSFKLAMRDEETSVVPQEITVTVTVAGRWLFVK